VLFHKVLYVFSLIFSLVLTVQTSASEKSIPDNTKSSFEAATKFTVKVRSVIKNPSVKDRRGVFTGAGFLVDKSRGWIVTNAHVTGRNPSKIEVKFKGEAYVRAKPIYIDPYLDFALLEMGKTKIPVQATQVKIDCYERPAVGSSVGAFGHPFGLDFTGTRGIVSGDQFKWSRNWIQTDAAINSGNSGGPLLALEDGRVIGINTAGLSKDTSDGIGFAIPAREFCPIIDRAKAGMDPSPVAVPVEISVDHDSDKGLNVLWVYSKGKGGWDLRVGDKVIGLKQKLETKKASPIKNAGDLYNALRQVTETTGILKIKRDNKDLEIAVPIKRMSKLLDRTYLYFSGITIAPRVFRDDEVNNPEGYLFVHDVKRRSSADVFGLQAYDMLASVDGKLFRSTSSLADYLLSKAGQKVTLSVYRRRYSFNTRSTYLLKEIKVEDLRKIRAGEDK
jgi:serine protease Do